MKDEAKTRQQLIQELGVLRLRIADLEVSDQQRNYLQEEIVLADDVARIVTSAPDISEVYQQFVDQLRTLVDFHRAVIHLKVPDADACIVKHVSGSSRPGRRVGDIFPLVEGSYTRDVMITGQTIIREDDVGRFRIQGEPQNLKLGPGSSIRVPLIANGRIIGTMGLHSLLAGAYGPREQIILERLASQIAPAVANVQVYEEVKEEIAVVNELSRVVTSALNIEEVYDKFALELKKLVDFDRAAISLVDLEAGTYVLKYLFGPARPGESVGSVNPIKNITMQRIVTMAQTVVWDDIATGHRSRLRDEFIKMGLRSRLVVPLISKGKVIGTLGLRSPRVGAYGPREQAIVERLASQIAPAVANVQGYEEVKEEIAVVNEVSRVVTSALNIGEVYEKFALELKKLVDFERAALSLVDLEAGTYVLKYLFGPARPGESIGSVNLLGNITMQRIVTQAQTVVWDDIATGHRSRLSDEFIKMGLRSRLVVPLISKGRVIGTLGLRSLRVGAYGPREQAIVERLARQITPAIANAAAFQELFSPREQEVLEQLTLGYSNNQIA